MRPGTTNRLHRRSTRPVAVFVVHDLTAQHLAHSRDSASLLAVVEDFVRVWMIMVNADRTDTRNEWIATAGLAVAPMPSVHRLRPGERTSAGACTGRSVGLGTIAVMCVAGIIATATAVTIVGTTNARAVPRSMLMPHSNRRRPGC